MIYTRQIVSFFILATLVGLGSLVLSIDRARADICMVEIQKVTFPADDTSFNFSATGGTVLDFNLMNNGPKQPLMIDSENPTTTVTEEVPPGWILDNVKCTEPGIGCGAGAQEPCLIITEVQNGLAFECLDVIAGLVTCTFTNEPSPTVPTLSEWGLIAMAGVLGIVGFMVIRRKKAIA